MNDAAVRSHSVLSRKESDDSFCGCQLYVDQCEAELLFAVDGLGFRVSLYEPAFGTSTLPSFDTTYGQYGLLGLSRCPSLDTMPAIS